MSGQTQNTLYENGIGWAIMLIIIAVLIWLFWYYFDTEVRDMVRWIKYSEMWVMQWFIDKDHTVTAYGREINWHEWFKAVPDFTAEELNYDHLVYFTALAMQPAKFFYMAILFLGALWCAYAGPNTHNRKNLGIEGLIRRQKHNFPVIAPFSHFNPSSQPPRPPGSPVPAELPLFAEALGPEEWLAYNSIPIPDGKINEEAVFISFRKQLVGRWKGWQSLKPYQQILLAAFCLKANRKRKEADDMLGRIALCWTFKDGLKLGRDKSLLKDARNVLRNEKLSANVLSKANQHAFITTAMLRALATAREEGGVLAPAQFVWLRAYDRTLWYPLNNLGRQSFHMEALGAMSHYRAEKMTQRPIPVPKLEDAVQTIVSYMASMRARPIPQLDYSQSKKRGIKKAK